MSAIEQLTTLTNRRRTPRYNVPESIAVALGRAEGILVDIALRGVRVRHRSVLGRGRIVRLSFEWRGRKFAAPATIMASRVVALDGPTYESRLHFAEVPHDAETVLRGLIASLEAAELRRAVENLRGLSEHKPADDLPLTARRYIRCRFFSAGRWEKKWTREAAQPDQGFTVPATLSDFEVAQLCRSFERVGAEGRLLLRKFAEAMIEDGMGTLSEAG